MPTRHPDILPSLSLATLTMPGRLLGFLSLPLRLATTSLATTSLATRSLATRSLPAVLGLCLLALGCSGTTHDAQRPSERTPSASVDATEEPPEAATQPTASDQASPTRGGPARSSSQPVAVPLRYPRTNAPWLGVELRATAERSPGVEAGRVLAGSPAAAAGLQDGDVLLSIAGESMGEPQQVIDAVATSEVGKHVPVAYLRAGNHRLTRVELKGKPEFEDMLRLAFVGRQAPEIAGVVTFQGESASLRELRGQVVVLEFWASWCGVCRYLAPLLDELHRDYQPRGVEVVGITVDPPKLGSEVARKTGMTYTLASDTSGTTTRSYMASQVPTMFVIDQSGTIRDVLVGLSRQRVAEMRELVTQLLDSGGAPR